jgi:hypothetical protein
LRVKKEEPGPQIKKVRKRYENLVEVVEQKKRDQKKRRKDGDLRYIYERRYLTQEEWDEVKFVNGYVYKGKSAIKMEEKKKTVGNNPETNE